MDFLLSKKQFIDQDASDQISEACNKEFSVKLDIIKRFKDFSLTLQF